MKTRIVLLTFVICGILSALNTSAKEEERNLSPFSEITLKIPGNLHLKQGNKQSVRIVANESTLKEITTQVRGRKLLIQFPAKKLFQRSWNPGKIDVYITIPDIDALTISGAGNILAEKLESRIINLTISGSGNITIDDLRTDKVKAIISGSGSITLASNDEAQELSITISGSGNFSGESFECHKVNVSTAGSGNCNVYAKDYLKARIAGSGNVYYSGNPQVETSIAGSGKVQKM